jgi:AmmeMemoRadiSam system protein A
MLTDTQKRTLMERARAAVEAQVLGRSSRVKDDRPASRWDAAAELPEASGAFVTIKRRGQLRGCLGTLQCRRGLAEEVARCAADAASEDPRFPPVAVDELPELDLEVSVLGPLQRIDPTRPDAFEIGRHGLVVEKGAQHGLLLPQVATEWGWTPEQFLRQTCVKAGLPADAWQHGATVYRFDADVFGD